MAQTYYGVLGVAENATNAEIEAAFKSRAKEVHPDRVAPGNPYLRKIASEAFKDLSEAKSVLLDRTERQKYDAELAYMRGSATNPVAPAAQPPYQASPPPPQTPPAPQKASQQTQKYSFWTPANTNFGSVALVAGGVGCLLLLGGLAGSEKTAFFGLALVFLSLALLSWRHGMRPSTDPKVLGGSVFLFIFAAMALAVWNESPSVGPKPLTITTTKAAPTQAISPAAPVKQPCVIANAKNCNASSAAPNVTRKAMTVAKSQRVDSRVETPSGPQPPDLSGVHASPASNGTESQTGIDNRAPVTPQPDIRPSSGESAPLDSATAPPRRSLSSLSNPERESIESACSQDKYLHGPAAYNQCLNDQLNRLGTAPRRPDLSRLSNPERESIESACSQDKYLQGPAAYNRCLDDQLNRLGTAPRRPSLSSLSNPERESIESACSQDKYLHGPAAYNRCLGDQLNRLEAAPRRPDLSHLSGPERESIESACSQDKYLHGPAAYNLCLLNQLDQLKSPRP